ncbi:tyrosine-type recombinase/integrase (plasmid) [Actinomadura graeca]|uniref:Tyrosine-type recombinase/integrase n=1 Tax=Actinomadura graeca TaxID=2750812 RepID=A0ABX8R7H8_9ACTN|nr:tyrosine-type recombinase/integrase [Actinomadura graeca]QXJ27059.1 tyrosine-type recombinase/integrase [Actinomadura graeca]
MDDAPLTGTLIGAAAAASRASVTVSPDGRGVDVPAPMVASVGDIAGLAPRRARGDGGEVAAADVDLVDALPRDLAWSTVAAWLTAGKSVSTRRARLADLAAWLRWLQAHAPGLALLAATEDTVTGYREAIATGTARAGIKTPGKPLSAASVARRLSSLASFYGYAVRRAGLARNPAAAELVERPEVAGVGVTPSRTLGEAVALLEGAERIAPGHPGDAAAVALLISTGLRAAEVAGLSAERIGTDAGHYVIRVRVKGGKTVAVPLPPRVCALVLPRTEGKRPADLIITREDGRPFDRWRLTTALRRAARAAEVDPAGLTPHVLRATAATLLLDAGVPVELVQDLLGHASPVTTQRYDRGTRRLDGHATYRLASILAGGA